MNKIVMKRWLFDKIQSEAGRYHTYIDVDYENGYYADTENDTVTAIVREVIKETEKAIQVRFSTGNIDGCVKGWISWVAKSQIVK